MGIMLGNLSLPQIESRLGITLLDTERELLTPMRQENAQHIEREKWHCFDIPFMIVCGDYDTACMVRDLFAKYAGDMKTPLQISWQK